MRVHEFCRNIDFYSRPCGRGDQAHSIFLLLDFLFLLTPLREGRPVLQLDIFRSSCIFLLTPLREGRRNKSVIMPDGTEFLLTPLREGRRTERRA